MVMHLIFGTEYLRATHLFNSTIIITLVIKVPHMIKKWELKNREGEGKKKAEEQKWTKYCRNLAASQAGVGILALSC